jgi:hypothetical protein
MASRKSRSRGAAPAHPKRPSSPSVPEERLVEPRRKLFAGDGRKLREVEHVGAMAPDTDSPQAGPPARPASHREPPRTRR